MRANVWKRMICMVMTLSLLLGLLPTAAFAAESNYSDVKSSDWCNGYIQDVTERGLMNGTGDGTFSPNQTTSRGMIVTTQYRMAGSPAVEGTSAFPDVAEGQYYASPVLWASQTAIVNGYDDGNFGPNDLITREQLVTMLYRYAVYMGYDVSQTADLSQFGDADQISEYAKVAVSWAVAVGLLTGTSDTTLSPQGNATRAQLAAFLSRFCELFDSQTDKAETGETETATFTVKFLLNDGTDKVYQTVQVKDGETAKTPTNPTRSGYTFKGWYTEKSGGTKFDFDAKVSGDVTVYAQWEKTTSSGGGGSSRGTGGGSTPVATYYTVTFESNGGSAVESQTVKAGELVTYPVEPEKDGCVFIGWYLSNGYSDMYNFNQPITSNVTVYAKWYDGTDTKDSDGDGLSDALEEEFGTDPNGKDTDNDGLPDYIELNWLNYNPLEKDTDNDGILDAEEDFDGDGLTNGEEVQVGTSLVSKDSDKDYVSDYDEVKVYHTNPLEKDTDSDGVEDGTELEIGSDPLSAQAEFEISATSGEIDENVPVIAKADVITDSEGAGTLQINEVSLSDNVLLSSNIAGYLGSAYDFSLEGSFVSSKITFLYDTALGEIGEDFQPRIYYFNEETTLLEELPNQTVKNGSVSADVSHFSTYILLNKIEFDKVWDTEIKPPLKEGEDKNDSIDIVFVVDYSYSMTYNDENNYRKTVVNRFIDKLRDDTDRGAVVSFVSVSNILCELTSDKGKLKKSVDSIVDDNGRSSYSGTNGSAGINSALNLLKNSDAKNKFVIFLTDGEDTRASYQYSDLIDIAVDEGIVIFTVGLGTADETLLSNIATGTGGKYYKASSGVDLSDIYIEIEKETVDLTTDTNNDGIPDYYTTLLNDGDLLLSTSNYSLVDVIDMYGESCDDWDGDGLKNGEEIQVCQNGNKVYVKMSSHPLLVDTDGDGYSDLQEKNLGTPPMKYTSMEKSALDSLENDSLYSYIDVANDSGVCESINAFFDFRKAEEAEKILINYFYDYASKDTIDKNQEKIAELEIREQHLKYAESLANLLKIGKDIYSITNDISGMVNGLEDIGETKEYVDSLKDKSIKIKGTSAQVRASRVKILNAINSNQLSDTDLLKDSLSGIDSMLEITEEYSDLFEEYEDIASLTEELTSMFESVTSDIAGFVSTSKLIYDGVKYAKLNTGFQKLSKGYKEFLKGKGVENTTSTYIGVAVDVVDGVIDIFDTCNTYGKMKANRDAYISYIDLMYYISENATEEYDRNAAENIAEIIEDESWSSYEKQIADAHTKTVVLTSLSIVADLCPYVNVVKAVGELTVSITGLANNAKWYVECRTMQSVSDGCINIIDSNIDKKGMSFSCNDKDYVFSYITQLAQCRVVGSNYMKDRFLEMDAASLFSRWINGMSKDDIEDMFSVTFNYIYDCASDLGLTLSSELPYYDEFNSSTGGGGVR